MAGHKTLHYVCAILGLIEPLINARAQTSDWSKRIVSKVEFPIGALLNPQKGDVNVLIIDKKRFEHVRGEKPFYLPVRGLDAIVFVTLEKNSSQTVHVFKMNSDEDIAIHLQNYTPFGLSIGASDCHDSAQRQDDGKVVLCTLQTARSTEKPDIVGMKEMYYLDLDKRSITSHNRIYLDKVGKVIDELDSKPTF